MTRAPLPIVRRPLVIAMPLLLAACMGTSDRGLTPSMARTPSAQNHGVIPSGTAVGGQAEWSTQGHDYALSRYSELAQITTATAPKLELAWSFSTGELRGHEGAPLV